MSDIHLLTGSFDSNGSGSIRVAYHFPTVGNGVSYTYPADASRTSEVTDITAQELGELQDGTLIERVKSFKTNKNKPKSEIVASIRASWQDEAGKLQTAITGEYENYGTTLDRSV